MKYIWEMERDGEVIESGECREITIGDKKGLSQDGLTQSPCGCYIRILDADTLEKVGHVDLRDVTESETL